MLIPHEAGTYEAWARAGYLHSLWLWESLRECCVCEGDWRQLLIGSGGVLRLDRAEGTDEPNILNRLSAIRKAFGVTGFATVFDCSIPTVMGISSNSWVLNFLHW